MFEWRVAAAAVLLVSPVLSHAQTQAQQDRLDRVARFVVTGSLCQRLGMIVDPDMPGKAEAAIRAEAAGWNLDKARVEKLKDEAAGRQAAMISTDLKRASGEAKSDSQLRGIRGVLLSYGQTCLEATTDPIFSSLIVAPPGYDMERAATELSDSMLAVGGLASWQTRRIQARGNLMMVAGSCRSKIGAVRSDALVKEVGQSDDIRVRDFYIKSFDDGLADPTLISTVAGCNKAIAAFRAKGR